MSVVQSSCAAVPPGRLSTRRRRRGGFTLVEMLVVLAIIGLISALVGPRVLNQLTDSRERAAQLQIEAFSSALDIFFIDVGRYPSEAEGLGALMQRPGSLSSWSGPYLRGDRVPLDPWGRDYGYASDGRTFRITTAGANGGGAGAPAGR